MDDELGSQLCRRLRFCAVSRTTRFGHKGVSKRLDPSPSFSLILATRARASSFVCLEGNENGTYFRGKTRLIDGRAKIDIPEEWQLVTEADGITVQVTAVGPSRVWTERYSREDIELRGTSDCEVHYLVNGVRRGFAKHAAIRSNREYRPDVRGVSYLRFYGRGVCDILVANGILDERYHVKPDTAALLGIQLRDPDRVPVEQRWWRQSVKPLGLARPSR